MDNNQEGNKAPTAFLVDLVSNRKIPIATPRCRVGRDDLNDIVISGDQSISRFHFIISYENGEFTVQDAKSRHGTFLNGNQLTVSESIKDGDVLKVGVSLFWFVVEGAQSESGDTASPSRVSPITDLEKAAAENSKVSVKTSSEIDATMAPTARSQEMTQEMQKPDAALMDKLEQAANAVKADEKPTPKASLASLLAGAEPAEPEPDKKKEELAALAAKDKELLSEMDEDDSKSEPAEKSEDNRSEKAKKDKSKGEKADEPESKPDSKSESKEEEKSSTELKESEIPARPVNKPSDTVTLEALSPPEAAAIAEKAADEVSTSTALDSVEASSETKSESTSEPESASASETVAESAEPATAESSAEVESAKEVAIESKSDDQSIAKSENSDTSEDNAGIIESSRIEASDEATGRTEAAEENSKSEPEPVTETETTLESKQNVHESGTNGTGSSKMVSSDLSNSQDLEDTKFIKAGASAVPDWCKRYFSDEIAKLNTELDELNEQVRLAQQKIRDVETRVALTRGIRNTLLTTTGDELVEACGKVLSLLGWKVTISAEDKHELRLEVEDKHVCIARVIWTTTKAERSHLGQLSISQTRYWMEKGVEPKGIIIVSKISGEAPTAVGDSPEEIELNDYAAKRNVCLMSTLQLLSLYKEIALADASPDKLRTSIVNASGWLSGHNLEPGTAEVADEESAKDSNKLSSLLSA